MSVIGTIYKQPRVFAHDATALADLCGSPVNAIATLAVAPPAEPGTGYAAGVYETITSGSGVGATVEVLTVTDPLVGDVATFTLTTGGEHYKVGDILTLIGGGSDDNCQIEIASITACDTWTWGDPIVPTTGAIINYAFEKETYYWNDGSGVHAGRACSALYVGANMTSITVIQEGKAIQGAPTAPAAADTPTTTYHNVPAGSFLPISVVTVTGATAEDEIDEEDYILALF